MSADPETTEMEKLTPEQEEQLAKEELKRAAKAKRLERKLIKAQLAQEALKLDKRNEFGRESKFVDTTYTEHAVNWEQMLVDINHEALRKEVEGLSADVTQMIDRKQNHIERLTFNRSLVQKQAKFNFQSQIDFLNYSKCK